MGSYMGGYLGSDRVAPRPPCLGVSHSARNDSVGSTRPARTAGIAAAIDPATINVNATAP